MSTLISLIPPSPVEWIISFPSKALNAYPHRCRLWFVVCVFTSFLSIRKGYDFPKTGGADVKAGYLPAVLAHYDVWAPFWDGMVKDVLRTTGDTEAVEAMLSMASDVTTMNAPLPSASDHEKDILWLKTSHRILYRLDKACHLADLSVLAEADSKEKDQAELRVSSLLQASARSARSLESAVGIQRQRPPFKRFRPATPNPRIGTIWCPHHKRMGNHHAADCRLAAGDKTSGPSQSGK